MFRSYFRETQDHMCHSSWKTSEVLHFTKCKNPLHTPTNSLLVLMAGVFILLYVPQLLILSPDMLDADTLRTLVQDLSTLRSTLRADIEMVVQDELRTLRAQIRADIEACLAMFVPTSPAATMAKKVAPKEGVPGLRVCLCTVMHLTFLVGTHEGSNHGDTFL